MKKFELSLLVLTRNEESLVEENLKKISDYLKNQPFLDKYEIVVSDYSEDSTMKIVEDLSTKILEIIPVCAPRKGIGCGLVSAVMKAKFPTVMFYPIDMSWDIEIIKKSLECISNGYDLVIGSRAISAKQVKRPFKRRFFSKLYNVLINVFFNLNIKDTQGTMAFKKSDFLKYKENLMSDDPFLQTELVIHSKKSYLKIIEIPSKVIDIRKDSSVNVLSFSASMLKNVIKKKIQLLRSE